MNKILTVKKKSVVQRAIQFIGTIYGGWKKFLMDSNVKYAIRQGNLYITTLEGEQLVQPSEWLVQDVEGNVYPVYEDKFFEIYDFANTHRFCPFIKPVLIIRKDLGETYKAMKFMGEGSINTEIFDVEIRGNKAYFDKDAYGVIGDILITDGSVTWSIKEPIFHQTYDIL